MRISIEVIDSVSIHARARRATRWAAKSALGRRFQFTPAHDGRLGSSERSRETQSFNSRPRTTGDRQAQVEHPGISVSIHARARRATSVVGNDNRVRVFQFTPAHDGRPRAILTEADVLVSIHARARRATGAAGSYLFTLAFQFTPAHDGRPRRSGPRSSAPRFNSRPRTTGDTDPRSAAPVVRVSIHARARRATFSRVFEEAPKCFNSRPRTTGDRSRALLARGFACFNSRPRTTGDHVR